MSYYDDDDLDNGGVASSVLDEVEDEDGDGGEGKDESDTDDDADASGTEDDKWE
ncbi:MAG: hypothetical protein U1D26_01635 [Patescibacteria group bacterium]|nr:hypothetical protein [bacterium]MDZ4227157.1 hypothetical protein [Patescibacteria group bacterium]